MSPSTDRRWTGVCLWAFLLVELLVGAVALGIWLVERSWRSFDGRLLALGVIPALLATVAIAPPVVARRLGFTRPAIPKRALCLAAILAVELLLFVVGIRSYRFLSADWLRFDLPLALAFVGTALVMIGILAARAFMRHVARFDVRPLRWPTAELIALSAAVALAVAGTIAARFAETGNWRRYWPYPSVAGASGLLLAIELIAVIAFLRRDSQLTLPASRWIGIALAALGGASLTAALELAVVIVEDTSAWPNHGLHVGLAAAMPQLLAILVITVLAAQAWKRRRFQFSLRSFLLLTAIISVILGCVARQANWVYKQKRVANAVLRTGGSVSYESRDRKSETDFDNWLHQVIGPEYLQPINRVTLRASDADLALLNELPYLAVLELSGSDVTDAGLATLSNLSHLKRLSLVNTRATDAGLVHLAGLAELETLDLHGNQITGTGLVHLKGCQLKYLFLCSDRITDDSLENLSHFPRLCMLELESDQITDAGLEHLNDLPRLEFLTLRGTKVTAERARELREALPNVSIEQ